MKALVRFTGHVLLAMVKGFVFTGLVAAVATLGAIYLTAPQHALTLHSINTVLAGVIVVLAGLLGAAVALIYHLTHLESARHGIQRYRARRDAPRQPARK